VLLFERRKEEIRNMETPVISKEAVELEGLDFKAAIQTFAQEQPFVMGALVAEYMRLPKTAVICYHLLRSVLADPAIVVSRETVEALDSVIQTDKKKLGQELIAEQPNLGAKLQGVYDYIPKPALLIYFGYKNQAASNEMQGSNLMKEPTEEEKHLKYLVSQVYQSLPSGNKDWLDPVLEAQMKDVSQSV
jgi:hypothetical protein